MSQLNECFVWYNKIIFYITFPERVKFGNVISQNMIINLSCVSVDDHIPWYDIYDYHPLRECNIYIFTFSKQAFNESLDVISVLSLLTNHMTRTAV